MVDKHPLVALEGGYQRRDKSAAACLMVSGVKLLCHSPGWRCDSDRMSSFDQCNRFASGLTSGS